MEVVCFKFCRTSNFVICRATGIARPVSRTRRSSPYWIFSLSDILAFGHECHASISSRFQSFPQSTVYDRLRPSFSTMLCLLLHHQGSGKFRRTDDKLEVFWKQTKWNSGMKKDKYSSVQKAQQFKSRWDNRNYCYFPDPIQITFFFMFSIRCWNHVEQNSLWSVARMWGCSSDLSF